MKSTGVVAEMGDDGPALELLEDGILNAENNNNNAFRIISFNFIFQT
jgi:hypothetical protein